jgi:hypothetical protein
MKYCSSCGSEYGDEVTACADCGGIQLITAEDTHRHHRPLSGQEDRRKFVRVGSAEDPLTSEHLTGVLQSAHIPILARSHGSVMDPITSPAGPWWEILVPEEFAAKASELIDRERARMAAAADDAARAAEEEEAETERSPERSK